MFVAEGLEFCLDGRSEMADEIELMLAQNIWRSRDRLPLGLLVTRWNGFGRLGRTTIFLFFAPQYVESVFLVSQGTNDICKLRPLIDEWARQHSAGSWGRFEDRYVDGPCMFLSADKLVLFYPKYYFERGFIPHSLIARLTIPIEIVAAPLGVSYGDGGTYSNFMPCDPVQFP